jgi:cell fate regulator YaaT (PSP1 superfamily)
VAELYQVEFKASRREFFYNTYYHSLVVTDHVIVQAEQGEDLGVVTRKIETEAEFSAKNKPRSILRKAGEEDMSRYHMLKEKEVRYQTEAVEIIARHSLAMKVVDVECLFDGGKITFFFTADHRVDFRALVRDLASRYRTRIELRQIGVRDEARRLDGYGICGRRQCCNSHLTDFAPVSTSHAREQDLSLNPAKISGNCGRLLCCLRYEVDMYTSAKKSLPPLGSIVTTGLGCGKVNRIDVFNEQVIFFNEEEVLCRARAKEITKATGTRGKWKPLPTPVEPETTSEVQESSPDSDHNDTSDNDTDDHQN